MGNRVEVLHYPGATSSDMVNNVDDILDDKSELLIVQVGTNNFTNDISALNNIKKSCH